MFRIESPDFIEGGEIPRELTCEGDGSSPHLKWNSPPEGTKSFLLIAEDPDAPMGTFIHWLIYDMPAEMKELPRGAGNEKKKSMNGIKEGLNDFGHLGYGGPCPPKGHGPHRYIFILKALDIPTLALANGAKRSDLERMVMGHVLAEARTTGKFRR